MIGVAAALIFVLTLIVGATPLIALPIGALCGVYALSYQTSYAQAAIIGAAGLTCGRIVLALAARRRQGRWGKGDDARWQQAAARLRGESRFRQLTFLAGMVPPLATTLFPTLGVVRAPLRYAALGTLVIQFIILSVTTTIFSWLAMFFTGSEHGASQRHDAAVLLAVVAIAWLILGYIRRFDWELWRTEHRIHFRESEHRFAQMWMRQQPPDASNWPGWYDEHSINPDDIVDVEPHTDDDDDDDNNNIIDIDATEEPDDDDIIDVDATEEPDDERGAQTGGTERDNPGASSDDDHRTDG